VDHQHYGEKHFIVKWRKRRIEQLANSILAKYGIATAPVPVKRLARELGIEVQVQPLKGEREMSGILIREGSKAIVGVNALHHENRQRFTIAHEIGHFLLHEGDRVFIDREYRVSFRNEASSEGTDVEEIEANAFASALLIPESLLIADINTNGGIDMDDVPAIERLARKYKVSRQAMMFRLVNRLG